MNTNLIVGAGLICFGLLTLSARVFGWEKLISQRQLAKERFGPRAGDVVHFIGYTAMPIIFGIIFLNNEYGLLW